jgi:intracellular sulfur oxidation DsrE/DsrF family protein
MRTHSLLTLILMAGLTVGVTRPQEESRDDDPTVKPKYVHPLIQGYGGVVVLPEATEQPQPGSKILLDITSDATEGKVIKGLARAALIMNQFPGVGIQPDQVQMAIVLHGPATKAALKHDAYAKHADGPTNANLELITRLHEAGVEIFVCGQALAHREYPMGEVAPEVAVAFSAATVNMNKQRDGYAYVPFI